MADAGELKVRINGNSSGLNKSLTSATSRLKSFSNQANNISDTLKKAFAFAGVTVSLMALKKSIGDAMSAYSVQMQAETKLAVIMRQRMGVNNDVIESIKRVAREQQKLGIIGDEVALSGGQQLATYLNQSKSLETLLPAMNNLIAQQKGVNASAQDAIAIGNLFGKAMQGNASALRRVGITFSEAEENVIKYGTESEKAAMLAKVIQNNVGDMNAELANTPVGKWKQFTNTVGDIKERFGEAAVNIRAIFLPTLERVANLLSQIAERAVIASQALASALGFNLSNSTSGIGAISDSADDATDSINDTNKAAKQLKNTIGGFDALNIIDKGEQSTDNNISTITSSKADNKPFATSLENLDKIKQKLEPIKKLGEDIKASIEKAFKSDSAQTLVSNAKSAIGNIIEIIGGIAMALDGAWNDNGAGDTYVASIISKWNGIIDVIKTVSGTVAEVFKSDTGKEFFDELLRLGTEVNTAIGNISTSFATAWNEAGNGQSIVDTLVSTASELAGHIADLYGHFNDAWTEGDRGYGVMSAIDKTVNSILSLVQHLVEVWRDAWDNDTTKEIFDGILGVIQDIFDAIGNVITNIQSADEQTGAFKATVALLQTAIDLIVTTAETIFNWFSQLVSDIDWTPLMEGVKAVATSLDNTLKAVKELVEGPLKPMLDIFGEIIKLEIDTVFKTIGGALKEVAKVIDTIVETLKAFAKLLTGDVKGALDSFKKAFEGLKDLNPFTNIENKLESLVSKFQSAGSKIASTVSNMFSSSSSMGGNISFGSVGSSYNFGSVPFAAGGGVFDKGQLFVANEKGPELVGSANGKSAVMNNMQIVDAVSNGVASAMSGVVSALTSQSTSQTVQIKGTDLIYVMQRAQAQRGVTISNNFAFGGV